MTKLEQERVALAAENERLSQKLDTAQNTTDTTVDTRKDSSSTTA